MLIQLEPDDFWQCGFSNHTTKNHWLSVCITSHKKDRELFTLLHALLAQNHQNFEVIITHDTFDAVMMERITDFMKATTLPITLKFTRKWYKDWGASLRERTLPELTSEWVLLTNEDNYYVPVWLDHVMPVADRADMIMWDMIHSYERPGGRNQDAYQWFQTFPQVGHADMGCFMVRTRLAQQVGFLDKTADADGIYCRAVIDLPGVGDRFVKINRTLFVHN